MFGNFKNLLVMIMQLPKSGSNPACAIGRTQSPKMEKTMRIADHIRLDVDSDSREETSEKRIDMNAAERGVVSGHPAAHRKGGYL